jgi:ferric-dicitrate binding protein FerR (iron transport regulator)
VSNSINEILLKPGQEALITSNNSAITVIEVRNPQHAMAWKTGIYIFEDESLTNILNTIADAHNKKLSINSLNAINKHYSVKFIRGEDLSTMLEVLADICPMRFRITQNEIIIDEK